MKYRKLFVLVAFMMAQALLIGIGLEIGLHLLKPHHGGLRQPPYTSTEATQFAGITDLPDLMNRSPFGFRPGATEHGFVLNSRSFRTAEYEDNNAIGAHRVLAIGDSFTYGVVPTADNWTTLLQNGFAQSRGQTVEVLNLGVPGTGTPFQLRLRQDEGRRLQPDLVISAFFVGNDFLDELGSSPGPAGFVDRLALVSHTCRLMRNLWRTANHRQTSNRSNPSVSSEPSPTTGSSIGYELPSVSRQFDEEHATMSEQEYLRVEAGRMVVCKTSEFWKFNLRMRRIESLLTRFSREVTDAGAGFLPMIIPDEFQVDPTLFQSVRDYRRRLRPGGTTEGALHRM